MKTIEVTDNGIIADFFTDDAVQLNKAIIMLGGSEGGKSWSRIKRPIEYLVQKGYAVLSLAYFKEKGLPNSLEEIPLEYFEKAFHWLSKQTGIAADEYAILGGSKGAEAGLVLGSKYPQVKAVIALSPSNVVWQGIPHNRFEIGKDIKSSWTSQGEGLPFLAYPNSIKNLDLLLLRLRKMHEEALQKTSCVKAAAIQVEDIQGAILLISGQQDRMWPAASMGKAIMERLETQNFDYRYEHKTYATGHNGIIMNRDCWRKIGDFLDENF